MNEYLSPLSCHPSNICRNIPYSLGFRIRRICSEKEDFEAQLDKLMELLLARGYKKRMVENAFERVRNLSREYTLEKVVKQATDKINFVITYDPRLTSIPGVLHKHARTLMMDSKMKETFQDGFQVAFKRHRNVREFLCRARLYDTGVRRNDTRAVNKGWRKCQRCMTCKRSRNMSYFVSSATKSKHQISEDICCKDNNVIYVVECTKCHTKPQYVGKSTRCLMVRGREHIHAIEKGLIDGSSASCKMYDHFTSNGHTSRDMLMYAIEVVHGDVVTTGVRERYWMQTLDTCRRGLNSNKT